MDAIMADPAHEKQAIYYYSSEHGHKRANAAYLVASWLVVSRGETAAQAFTPFFGVCARVRVRVCVRVRVRVHPRCLCGMAC